MKRHRKNQMKWYETLRAMILAICLLGAIFLGGALLSDPAWAASPRTLQGVPVPTPPNLTSFVADVSAAIRLGKAFFWDMQVGSDGIQACASCHFQAGADSRYKNQLDPGLRGNDNSFQFGGPNLALRASHFPTTTNDIVGSQGCVNNVFAGVASGSAIDNFTFQVDPNGFQVSSANTRRVTARNTPPTINAVHYFNNFWDGRAKNIFNGNNPSGPGFEDYLPFSNLTGTLTQAAVVIQNASAASQATGPPRADEMSWAGRTWPDIGKKMLTLAPLAKQKVSPADSVLGAIANPAGKGLTPANSYISMIQAAFQPEWWNSAAPAVVGTTSYTQMEANFPLFWGLAIQLYEATLISDQTPFDQFDAGNNGALNAQEQSGLNIFNGKGGCAGCHGGHLLSDASDPSTPKQVDNIGVRPVGEDVGAGAVFGAAFDGFFKIPGLRNIELTGPYFHNGGKLTLDEVIDFYDRGGDFPNAGINNLGLSAQEKADLKAFLLALTDERVRQESAPFDHPEIWIPHGHAGTNAALTCSNGGAACDAMMYLPAIGAAGRLAQGEPPVRAFLEGAKYYVAGDYDNDGKTDVTVWRPSNGAWFIKQSSTGGSDISLWGDPTDVPVMGDYDGDGKPDYAVWRPSNGAWFIINSSTGAYTITQWGDPTDVPVMGDYDGDGKTDIAVWRPGNGAWFIINSSTGAYTITQWGDPTDVPVTADYDGDGKDDIAVWRPSNGAWFVINSSTGASTITQWGDPTDHPVVGDYDGDGKADIAVWRPSNGAWFIINSLTGAVSMKQWGEPTDVPIVGDYDGDGKCDIGVWRASAGMWYTIPSTGVDTSMTQWGGTGDVPISLY